MTQIEAPVGTLGTIGHPANKRYIVKFSPTEWRYVLDGKIVDNENFRGGWDALYVPPADNGE